MRSPQLQLLCQQLRLPWPQPKVWSWRPRPHQVAWRAVSLRTLLADIKLRKMLRLFDESSDVSAALCGAGLLNLARLVVSRTFQQDPTVRQSTHPDTARNAIKDAALCRKSLFCF